MDDDFAALGTGARDLLAAKGPLPLEALAGLLDVPPAVLRQAMEAHPHMLPAPGGEWVSGLRLADSVAFTHELSAAEVARGMLSGDDDLALWAVFATAGLPLAAGGEAGAASAQDLPPGPGDDLPVGQGMIGQFITGPDGWLAGYSAGDLLSARLRDGALEISGQEPPAPGPGTVRLRDACASAAVQALEDYGRGAAAQPFAPLDGILVRRLFTSPAFSRLRSRHWPVRCARPAWSRSAVVSASGARRGTWPGSADSTVPRPWQAPRRWACCWPGTPGTH